MGIFLFCMLLLTALLLTGMARVEIHSQQKKEIVLLRIWYLGIPIYKAMYCVLFKYDLFPRIIRIKKDGFTYLPLLRKKKGAKARRRPRWQAFLPCIQDLRLLLQLGVGDAAQTAMCCGFVKQAVDTAICIQGVPNTYFSIKPDFENICIQPYIHGIFRVRIAKIISIILKEKRRIYASDRKHS